MVSMEWVCGLCRKKMPVENREVHELRCAHNHVRPRGPSLPGDMVFASRDTATPGRWRQVDMRDRDGEPARSTNEFPPHVVSGDLNDSADPYSDWEETCDTITSGTRRQVDVRDRAGEPARSTNEFPAHTVRGDLNDCTDSDCEVNSPSSIEHVRSASEDPSSTEVPIRRHSSRRQARGAGGTHVADEATERRAGARHWACPACTFDNPREAPRCSMCSTRAPAVERLPDRRYHEVLIDNNTARSSEWPIGDAEWNAALQEAARCEREEEVGRMRGGGPQWGAGDNSLNPTVSDAAAGSALGALSAGMISALAPGNRPGRLIASVLQGAVVGGVAGAALGSELRRGTSTDGDRGSDLARPGGSTTSGAGADSATLRRLSRARDRLDLHREGEGTHRRNRYSGVAPGARRTVLYIPAGFLRPNGNRPASASTIAHLPQEILTAESIERMPQDDRQCCICIEEFSEADAIIRLPCLHLYHARCISSWLQQSGTCPTCKHRVD